MVQVNWRGDEDSCGVVADEEHGGYIAAQHLLERGRTRLAFAGGPFTLSAVADRLAGAQRAVAEVPGATLETIETPRITVRGGTALGEELMRRSARDRPDGLVAASDALGSGAIQVLRLGGVSVPEDIAVVGYDNNHFSHDSPVPMTSVGQPGHEMGATAARMLLEEISSLREHQHRTVKFEPVLYERQSTPAL